MAKTPKKPTKVSASSQTYLDIEEIKEDVVVLKNGSMRGVIYVSSINFDLKSEDEREAIIGSFQMFLNSLNFPIQIVVSSRRIDLNNYLETLLDLEKKQKNELLKQQTAEYIDFMAGLLDQVNIMEKKFFVTVPYYPNVMGKLGIVDKVLGKKKKPGQTDFQNDKIQLMDRVDVVVAGLKSVGLNSASLDTNGLIQLYYSMYNPETSKNEKIRNPEDTSASVVQFGGMKEHKDAKQLEI